MSESIKTSAANIVAKQQVEADLQQIAAQEESSDAFIDFAEEGAFVNTWAAEQQKREKFKHLEERKPDIKALAQAIQAAQTSEQAEQSALRFQNTRNQELNARSLLRLLGMLKRGNSKDEIIKAVRSFFPDDTLCDDALDFLLENTQDELQEAVKQAKEEHEKTFSREILAGRNIANQAREFSNQGLGDPTALRNLYRMVTGSPPETPNLFFDQLAKSYTFEQLKTVVSFLLHSMGADLKNNRPSIEKGKLAMLFTQTRSLQAILGVYRFFQARMRVLTQSFKLLGQAVPQLIGFESLAKTFVKILENRYPSPPIIIRSVEQFGVMNQTAAQIAIITQWRDAVRNVSPRLFKTPKERDDLLTALLKTLEELEDKLEAENEGKK